MVGPPVVAPRMISKLGQDVRAEAAPAGPEAGSKLQPPMSPMPFPQRPAAFAPKAEMSPPVSPSSDLPPIAGLKSMPGGEEAAAPVMAPKMATPADATKPVKPAVTPAITASPAPLAPSLHPVASTGGEPDMPAPQMLPAPKTDAAALAPMPMGEPKPITSTKPAMTANAPAATTVLVDVVVTPALAGQPGQSDEQRAMEMLASEKNQGVQLHALQKEQPNYNIVVCEAGCGDAQPHVISKQLKSLVRSVANDPALANTPVTKNADCQGGCQYTGGSRQASAHGPKLLNQAAGAWMTTVTPPLDAAPVAPIQPQASKGSRDDWMARINRERADGKPATPATEPATDPKT